MKQYFYKFLSIIKKNPRFSIVIGIGIVAIAVSSIALLCFQKDMSKFSIKNILATHEEKLSKPDDKSESEESKDKKATKVSSPRHTESPSGMTAATTTKNDDGSTTTVVGEGEINESDLDNVKDSASNSSSPLNIYYDDQTGKHSSLGSILESYLNSTLKWGDEVPYLYGIIVRDAGNTGWSGLYTGSYTQQPSGDITSAYGWITLNTYYDEGDANFNDEMKLIFSHEYGHHYTLYHKYVDYDLGVGDRFPDSYYTVRPLSKATTATDYSKGWQNCEAEIIAEDYSYLWSGYNSHEMSDTYGFPSNPGTKNWLINFGGGSDNPPTVSVTSPADGATLSGITTIRANANDDIAIVKVSFYVDSKSLGDDTTAPYEKSFTTERYASGSHTLKAAAYDSSHNTEAIINVTFDNNITDDVDPTVTITNPASDPYNWTSGDLTMEASGTDNIGVAKIELYLNDYLLATENSNSILRVLPYDYQQAGTYTLKAKAYDAAGNTDEASITVNKP